MKRMMFSLRSWNYRTKERLVVRIAGALPSWLQYRAAIVVGVHATTGKYSNTVVPEMTFLDAIKRFGEDKLGEGR